MPGFNAHIIILGVLCDQIVIAIALGSLKNYLKVPKVRFFYRKSGGLPKKICSPFLHQEKPYWIVIRYRGNSFDFPFCFLWDMLPQLPRRILKIFDI